MAAPALGPVMARMFPAVYAPSAGEANDAERRLFLRLQRELDGNWQVVHDAGHGFVLLHRDLGIVLLSLPGTVEPGEIVAEMRAQLDEIGFSRNFQSDIAIIAEELDAGDRRDLFAVLAAGFASVAPATPTDPTWPDWLMQRLIGEPEAIPVRGAAASAGPPGLRGPEREDSWRAPVAATPVVDAGAAMRVVPERRLHAEDLDTRSPLWTGMALAVFVVAVVLVAMALLSYGNGGGNRPAPAPAATSR
jgi:hypothetical protein